MKTPFTPRSPASFRLFQPHRLPVSVTSLPTAAAAALAGHPDAELFARAKDEGRSRRAREPPWQVQGTGRPAAFGRGRG